MKIKANKVQYFIKVHQQNESKPTLLLLHGFMGSGSVFGDMIEELKSFSNPITIDLLGHGKTDSASSAERFQTQRQVGDLAVVLQKISEEPCYLHGYSMGGRLALQLALTKPNMLKGLILESTNSGLNQKDERIQRRKLDDERAQSIETNFKAFLEEWKNVPLFKNSTASDAVLKQYQKIQRSQNPQQMAFSLRGFGTGQMPAAHFAEIEVPTLLIAGEKDEKYVDIATEMDKQNKKSILKIIPDAAHRVHVNNPTAMIDSLNNFCLRQLKPET